LTTNISVTYSQIERNTHIHTFTQSVHFNYLKLEEIK